MKVFTVLKFSMAFSVFFNVAKRPEVDNSKISNSSRNVR